MINEPVRNVNDILFLKKFSKIVNLSHGFSSRSFGNMKANNPKADESLKSFSQALDIDYLNIIKMNQVHGDHISWVNQETTGQTINEADGLLTCDKNIFLSVLTADCMPVLIYDLNKEYVGIVHAGWRGIEKDILKKAIDMLSLKGGNSNDIIIGVGPCIRSCCYNVNESRVKLFKDKYPEMVKFYENKNGKTYLNLPEIAKYQLKLSGIKEKNIDDCLICTSCNNDRFYSFRQEGEKYGDFVGLIGKKN